MITTTPSRPDSNITLGFHYFYACHGWISTTWTKYDMAPKQSYLPTEREQHVRCDGSDEWKKTFYRPFCSCHLSRVSMSECTTASRHGLCQLTIWYGVRPASSQSISHFSQWTLLYYRGFNSWPKYILNTRQYHVELPYAWWYMRWVDKWNIKRVKMWSPFSGTCGCQDWILRDGESMPFPLTLHHHSSHIPTPFFLVCYLSLTEPTFPSFLMAYEILHLVP